MNFKVNANEKVKVKLTDFGIAILKEQHEELHQAIKERNGEGLDRFKLNLDEDGYYSTQMWMLMGAFGHVMSMGSKLPFDLNIIITNGEPIND